MDTIKCITSRMSIREFRPDPVPKEIIMEVIQAAQRSPSYKNSQPWEVIILSGRKKEALSGMLTGLFEKGTPPCPDLPEPAAWPPAEAARIKSLYKKRIDATGIDLNDPDVLKKAKIANFHFYGAPHAVYLYQHASLSDWSLFDLGLFAQSLMLAAHARGIGTVPQAFATDYARDVKKFLEIPETRRLVLGISLGYPDMSSPANALRTDRADVAEIVKWIE